MGSFKQSRCFPEIPVAATRYVTGVHSINDIGGHIQVMFYRDEISEAGKVIRHVLNAPHEILTMPSNSVPDAIGKAMVAIGRNIFAGPSGSLLLVQ